MRQCSGRRGGRHGSPSSDIADPANPNSHCGQQGADGTWQPDFECDGANARRWRYNQAAWDLAIKQTTAGARCGRRPAYPPARRRVVPQAVDAHAASKAKAARQSQRAARSKAAVTHRPAPVVRPLGAGARKSPSGGAQSMRASGASSTRPGRGAAPPRPWPPGPRRAPRAGRPRRSPCAARVSTRRA